MHCRCKEGQTLHVCSSRKQWLFVPKHPLKAEDQKVPVSVAEVVAAAADAAGPVQSVQGRASVDFAGG